MSEDLTAEAILEFPWIFKLGVARVRGAQCLSVERSTDGIVVEVSTDVGGSRYRVLTSAAGETASSAPRVSGRAVALYVGEVCEGVLAWIRTPSGQSWQTSFIADKGIVVRVVTSDEAPPRELRLRRTTLVEELPPAFKR